jgi:hypothetical protein
MGKLKDKAMKKLQSAIIWQGPSPVDGAPMVALISGMDGSSENTKTGPVAQVAIVRADIHPLEAWRRKLDISACGNCPLRDGRCYVDIARSISSKWNAFNRGNREYITPTQANAILKANGVGVRMGEYGDPAIVPLEVWRELIDSIPHLAYTHQWREDWFDANLLDIAMASIDDVNTRELAKAMYPGVRTYRMAQSYDELDSNEIKCPSKATDGTRRVQCADCGLCAGTSRKAKDIVIVEND